MKPFFCFRRAFAAAFLTSLALHPVLRAQTAPLPATAAAAPARAKAKTIPLLKITAGPLTTAIEEVSQAIRGADLPEMNVIVSPEARQIHTPELLLRNVSGPDALRLLAVSVGCDVEAIDGAEDTIGYRVYAVADHSGQPEATGRGGLEGGMGAGGGPAHMMPHGLGGGMPHEVAQTAPSAFGPPVGGMSGAPIPGANPYGSHGPGGISAFPGMMPGGGSANVHVYGLGGISNQTKFLDIETTLREVLKAAGISSEAAKLAFHERTNVLVVTADPGVHALVAQFLDALQKNAAVAVDEQKRTASARHEIAEAMIRLQAEQEQRKRLSMQLDEAEARLREAQREIDRLKAASQKPN